jgi:sugar O-acyltransferase (sialic acid O-acetyltransferase NeuD family)
MKTIAIIGAGGHAKVIVNLIKELKIYRIVGFYDDDENSTLYDIKYLGKTINLDNSIENFIIGIGNNKIRKKIYEKNQNVNWHSLIHPKSIIAENIIIGEGTVVCAGCIIETDVSIGKQCIINTGCNINHECCIDDFTDISPSATICGQVNIGKSSFIGANCTILQCISIGDKCIIGAGSVIIKNTTNNAKIVGNPGRIL